MRTKWALFVLVMVTLVAMAYVPSTSDYNGNQFSFTGGRLVNIVLGSRQTNTLEQIYTAGFWKAVYPGQTTAFSISASGTFQMFDNVGTGNAFWQYVAGSNAFAINTNCNVAGYIGLGNAGALNGAQITGGAIDTNAFKLLSANGQNLEVVTTNGAAYFGSNNQMVLDTSGNASIKGVFAGDLSSGTNMDYTKITNAPPRTTLGNGTASGANVAPIYFAVATTLASSSNSVPLAPAPFGTNYFLSSATPVNFTNAIGSAAGYIMCASITTSNSTAAAFTNRCDPTWVARGYAATNANATLGFNGFVVPAGKEVQTYVETRGVNETNFWVSY